MTQDKQTIYLFFGEDNFSSIQKVAHWKREFEKKYGDINIETLEGKGLLADTLAISLKAAPFLGEKRLIIIENFLDKGNLDEQKKIANLLEKKIETTICVFLETKTPDQRKSLFKKIKKVGQIQEFKFLTDNRLTEWILDKAKSKETQISTPLAKYLGSLTGQNLWNLQNELEKLRLYCKNREVKKEDIDKLVKPALTSSIFKLTDQLAAKNHKESLETFNILKENGEELIMILFMIVRHFRILLQVCDLMRKGYQKQQIMEKIKEHPYVIEITLNQCKNFKPETLRQIYKHLHELDIAIKTGKIRTSVGDQRELILAIEKFIVKMCL